MVIGIWRLGRVCQNQSGTPHACLRYGLEGVLFESGVDVGTALGESAGVGAAVAPPAAGEGVAMTVLLSAAEALESFGLGSSTRTSTITRRVAMPNMPSR